ncbi:uncharacterized protein CYBJADRAFT_166281 [Cyberlindnera jadinii NRRL Y-1542]|uniref:Uncharacterized protein n=1 Tax=Cyberlindnera jadinii (strain ATCC 18201 / CBS 1600 / BCRC 20928 / JCM 3617 / NBRC 0987 / NRRL Y-1542) TaxID=983966 RepID=A0A1E4S7S0_CYBJN|nr:hypothetical protein CYBJADRAFT_166281 [Cyberlindnera jadinii NRRL Y-1542]ODV75555.1 hypothetical protein CYBJADRAFT_166281 [Cyberlindnera jadinii NRRL Y-1542]
MDFLNNIKDKVGDEVVEQAIKQKASSFFGGDSDKKEQSQGEKEGQQSSDNNNNNNNEGEKKEESSSGYAKKIESFIGDDNINAIKQKVGEDNFKKGESFIDEQIKSRFN